MTPQNIIDAIRVTAKEYEQWPEAKYVVYALRGIVARAERYEALEQQAELEAAQREFQARMEQLK